MKFAQTARRLVCAVLCAVMLTCFFSENAFALSKGTVYVQSTTAKVYKKKSTSSSSLGSVSFGQKLTCTSVSGSWAKVKNSSGKTGYMKTDTLTQTDPNAYSKTVYIQKDGVKVYAHASTASKKIATVNAGDRYTAVAKSGKWLRIKNGKYYGYVLAANTGASYTKGTKVYMTERCITVMSSPDSWDSIGAMSFGQSCWLLEKGSGYVKLRSGSGKIGYLHSTSSLSTTNPNTLNKTLYVQTDNVGYYPSAVLSDRKGTLGKNTAVTAVAYHSDGWYRVKINGKYYYMLAILLDETKAPAGGRVYYANDISDYIYEKPSISAKKVASVKEGDKLTLIGCKGSGLKVKTADGKVGYILSSQLSKTK